MARFRLSSPDENQYKNPKALSALGFSHTGPPGLEPGTVVLETTVLPIKL